MDQRMQRLTDLTADLVDTDTYVAELEKNLKVQKQHQRLLAEDLIPDEMRATGQDLLRLPTGQYLELFDEIKARIPKDTRDEAYAYLEEIGEGGMVKRMVVCEFRKDQEEEAKGALEALRHAGFHHAYFEKTHAWNTFQKWVEERMDEGKSLPKDVLGITLRTVAKVRKK